MKMDSQAQEQATQALLDDFLSEWKQDLLHCRSTASVVNVKSSSTGQLHLGKRQHDTSHVIEEYGEPLQKKEVNLKPDTLPLFVLPGPQIGKKTVVHSKKSKIKLCSLVDTLISDLNDINTIPFFDVELPQEIALVIFSFLSMKDLCACCQVSKSWNVLAEDNALWFSIYSQLYPHQHHHEDFDNWKELVRERYMQNVIVFHNWKERKCGVRDYQPDSAGVLVEANFADDTLISCYTSGLSMLWNIKDQSDGLPIKWLSSDNHLQLSCCSANSRWGAVGTRDGRIHVIDVHACSEVDCLVESGAVCGIELAPEQDKVLVARLTNTQYDGSLTNNLTVLSAEGDSWERVQLVRSISVKQMSLLKRPSCGACVLYSTPNKLTIHPVKSTPTDILSPSMNTGYISCFNNTSTRVACGTSTFGYKVQVFDLNSGSLVNTCNNHGQQVTCVSIFKDGQELLASGSADKCIRVYDVRSGTLPVVKLYGHGSIVSCLQMDEWKIASGSLNGTLIVWDQRMNAELWRNHERHPVTVCSFDRQSLVACFVPVDKTPVIDCGNPFIFHRRHRGLVRVYDFSTSTSLLKNTLPSECTSGFNEPDASFYNLDLKYPYDAITN